MLQTPRPGRLILGAALVLALAAPAPASAAGCDRTIGPGESVQTLVDSLSGGQTGCLRSGTYIGGVTVRKPGITVRPGPGQRAAIQGRVWVAKGANRVAFEGLKLDGRNTNNLPSPTINAEDATFRNNDVTNHNTAICFVLGTAERGRARRTRIESNRIHHCGVLPANNHDHGIYVEASDDARIIGNWIYDNADRGVQLYPDAQRTLVSQNVIDGNATGVIFSGTDITSNGNHVESNVISNARIRFNVESYYSEGTPAGRDNVAAGNCLHAPARTDRGPGGVDQSAGGFTSRANFTADPEFSDRGADDFRLLAGSSCRRALGSRAEAVPGPDGLGPLSARALRIGVRGGVVRSGRPTVFSGRANRRRVRSGSRVSIMVKSAGSRRYRTVGATRVRRNGRFTLRRKMRPRGRAVKVIAVAGRRARSKPIRVRVRG